MMRSMTIAAIAFLTLANPALCGDVAIEILEPSAAAEKFTEQRIQGADAPFSTPDEERSFLGVLEAPTSDGQNFCEAADYTVSTSTTAQKVILVIARGSSSGGPCTLHKKVLVAQQKGAKGVIIYDIEGKTVQQLQQETISEDPTLDTIKIPAIMITGDDGNKLIAAVTAAGGAGKVSAEFLWSYEKRAVPRVMYWSSAGDDQSDAFLKEFSELALGLTHDLDFRANYYIYRLPAGQTDSNNLCITKSAETFCAVQPTSYTSTGALAVSENMRRKCLEDTTTAHEENDTTKAVFSEAWWKYVKYFTEECKDKVGDAASMQSCSYELIAKYGGDKGKVEECLAEKETTYLQTALSLPGNGVRDLILNDNRYVSFHTGRDFAWRLCHSYPVMPVECVDYLRKFGYPVGGPGGLPWWAWLLIAIAIVVFLVGCYLLYRFVIVKHLRKQMRYEVMSEVRQQTAAAPADPNAPAAAAAAPAGGAALGPPVKPGAADDDLGKPAADGKGAKEDNPFTIQRADTSTSLKIEPEEAAGDEGPGPTVDV